MVRSTPSSEGSRLSQSAPPDIDPTTALLAEGPLAAIKWRRDAGWRVVAVTRNIAQVVGYTADELSAGDVDYADIIHEQDNPSVFERVGMAATQGETSLLLEYRVVARDARVRRILDRTLIERDAEGEACAFTSYLIDVTDAPARPNVNQHMAHLSHEIRTPLSGMLGLTEALAEQALEPDQREIVLSIREAGASLLQLLNNMLDLSKIEAGQMGLDVTDFRLGELCTAAERLFARRASANNVTIATTGQAMDISLRGDAGRLRQILYNLVGNAVKFTQDGRIEIAWCCDPPDADERIGVRLTVADTGVGMNPETLATIFQSYRQASASVAAEYGGTGLGLAISRQLATLMGGRLWAESQPGEGSRFHFEARFEASSDAGSDLAALRREEANAAGRAAIAARAPHILAAEDAVANQRVLQLMLAPVNATVVIARDGREAVEMFAANRYDAVLMDSRMPRLSGVEATAEIRRIEREQGRGPTPILALTAETQALTLEAFRAAGADAVMAKPFDPQRLYRTLAQLLTGVATDPG